MPPSRRLARGQMNHPSRARYLRQATLACVWLIVVACSNNDDAKPANKSPARDSIGESQLQTRRPAPSTPRSSSGCLVDEGGCRAKISAIDTCESDTVGPALTVQQVLAEPARHVGMQIALRGPLIRSGAECTELSCEQTCCNTCTSIMAIADSDGTEYVRLHSAREPGLFMCRGDESSVCCQFSVTRQETIALGTFQATVGVTPPVYQLFTTELCTPAAATLK